MTTTRNPQNHILRKRAENQGMASYTPVAPCSKCKTSERSTKSNACLECDRIRMRKKMGVNEEKIAQVGAYLLERSEPFTFTSEGKEYTLKVELASCPSALTPNEKHKYQVRIRKDRSGDEVHQAAVELLGACTVIESQTLYGSFSSMYEAFAIMSKMKELEGYEIISVMLVDKCNQEQLGEDYEGGA